MVMKRNAMRTNLRQSILKSFGRYIALCAIIALGAALFVGLLMTKSDMVATGQVHMDRQNMFDIRLVSTYGWARDQVAQAAQLEGIEDAEGVLYVDLITRYGDTDEDTVYRYYALPERIDLPSLRGGRMPETPNECLVDGYHTDDSVLGTRIRISEDNDEDDLEVMLEKEYTVVGYVASPLYMDMNRGTTSVGTGILTGYVYLPGECFDADYFSEIHLTIPGSHKIYSDAYNTLVDDTVDAIELRAEEMGRERFDSLKAEAEEEYQDGYEEYLDGLKEYEEGKAEADQELADAYQELIDGEQEIKDTQQELEWAEAKLADGLVTLDEKEAELKSARRQLKNGLEQAEPQRQMLEGAKKSLEQATGKKFSELKQIASTGEKKIAQIDQKIQKLNDKIANGTDPEKIAKWQAQIVELQTTRAQIAGILTMKGQIDQISYGLSEINKLDTQLSQVESGLIEIEETREEIKANITKVYNGYEELEEARQDIKDGWKEYYEGKAEAEKELADAEEELREAEVDLAEAREDIDAMDEPDVIILDRTSNVGYNNLESASDIVQGVSRILPVFFLLIASLVCITTMTRMIDEERTQIGTLKALGYSNGAIISKYMIYAGSGAVIGCGLGVFVGSSVFPMILWEAYKIMLYISDTIVLTVNWGLCFIVVAVYSAVILGVTWYCCHKTLEEEPAELIRPKAPDAGKALFVEKLPFWRGVSFLNKVMIRNIFRYRQRMAMMLVGIGGCTALLITGFGLRDSILNVVDYQFEEVTLYDLEVNFRNAQTEEEQEAFLQEIRESAEEAIFFHQSSMDLSSDSRTKEVYVISAGPDLEKFIDLHAGKEDVAMPGEDEVVLSIGVADMLDLKTGDRVTLRNSDLQTLELTVSGIYDNHVNNYAVVSPQTIEKQWQESPEIQMAYVKLAPDRNAFTTSTEITEMDDVMNVAVSEDLASMVSNMMEALDLVIVVIVISSGLLAVIVLYNLTNININERIREIATIKVLGFNASETAAYVFKENMTLTVAGSILGIGLGYLMLIFVMSQVKIDMVWFKALVLPASYVISVILTILAAVIVDFVFYFKLQTINMAEALKSVE